MSLKVCLAGATGWAGSELARGIAASADLDLVAAVSRRHAGQPLGMALGDAAIAAPVYASAAAALAAPCDIFVEYTHPDSAKANILAALERGAHVVVGTSGLSDEDYAQIDALARERRRGVLACGNFALTAVLLIKFAEMAAKLIPQWELVDYASAGKPDAPSGTVRELATRMGKVRQPQLEVPLERTVGLRETRGGTLAGSQVHALRLPGFVIGAEAIFGMPDQTLTIRHHTGNSAKPYVDGALLAIRKVGGLLGLHRGLDVVLEL
ncbi:MULTISPECIES: 4-hydroxy-tetrahydrodipicolinate reductase [Rhodanobacter]|uniref:4-hydroxy-tetrahydrodipicolinate reductase n=1 Tax=Rhodanobacter TaxID=75309 RepID=UPI0004024837|nr:MULTISPECIES: 4-hydroxy-tetrahydrodipicolinate reductase [Rhodanobacter]TAN18898.1 MAG: 4-hydroxy-tetrahydrodipicolinate reductase [Rhodanobacter sp.]UJJ55606.1 4-hydroxy-tetrahydrodipicolinate reductase [Rhodanobacter thiooxydans]